MKARLLLLLIIPIICNGQADSSNSFIMSAGCARWSMSQMNESGFLLATKQDTSGWVILQPDSLMAYFERREIEWEERYYKQQQMILRFTKRIEAILKKYPH